MQLIRCIMLTLLCWYCTAFAFAQQTDTTRKSPASYSDSAKKAAQFLLQSSQQRITENAKSSFRKLTTTPRQIFKRRNDSVQVSFSDPFRDLFDPKPFLRFTGGYTSYNFSFRSNVDTPYVESDIAQHNVIGQMNFQAIGILPLTVTYRIRQSNSAIFRDITDVQVSFNAGEFRNQVQNAVRKRLLALAPQINDSITGKLYELKKLRGKELSGWLQNPLQLQKMIESYEILRIPRITYLPQLSDSANAKREDSLKKAATVFLGLYEKTKAEYARISAQADSLQKIYEKNLAAIRQYRQMVQGQWRNITSLQRWKDSLKQFGMEHLEIPSKYRWLAGLRQLSLGRAPVNYSDLTARNISITGINVEYNSWYYFAFSAGVVDYRFRDFAVNRFNRTPQHLLLVRAGVGRLEHNYFILSAYRGRKQLFRGSSGAGMSSMDLSGVSVETNYHITPQLYVNGEIGASVSPDFRTNPPEGNTKLNFSDKTNKAYAVRLHGWWPELNTRVEAFYRYTGANFQSFSSFQNNAARESWSVKVDQNYFKRKLRISASLRSNEFSNPFIVQQYKSNTIFKSISASLRMRKWPVITVGYLPMSQLTKLDSQLVESRFQALNGSLFHQYKVQGIRASSTLIYNRFYNSNSDTGFVYYNATNVLLSQSFFFPLFTVTAAASHTGNSQYELNVLDGFFQLNLTRPGSFGVGVKINNLDRTLIKMGGYLNAAIRIGKYDMLYVAYEHGYLPGYNKGLVRNELATIQFTKYFNYR